MNYSRRGIVGPSFSGKTYLMEKKLKNNYNRDNSIRTRSREKHNDEFNTED